MDMLKAFIDKSMKAPPMPYWVATTPNTNYPSLKEDIKVDVVIIGGGLVGLSTAYMLVKSGVKVALLEVDKIVKGTTGHTTAKITSQHGLIYNRVKNNFNEDMAKLYADANQNAIEKMESIIKENNIDCDFIRQDSYIYTMEDKYVKKICDEAELASRLGISAHYLDKIPLPFSVKAAVRFDNQAQFHPRKYLLSLADIVTKSGCQIYENTKVRDIDEGTPCTVITQNDCKVTADYVVLASHFPFYDSLGLYFARMYPERSYGLATRVKDVYPGGMYITAEDPGRSIRSQSDENGQILIISGEHHRTGTGDDMNMHYEKLIEFAYDSFTLEDVLYRWSTQDYKTIDYVPYIGRINADNPNVFVATGFKKWGMTTSTVSAMIISDLILNRKSPWEEVYNPARRLSLSAVGNFILDNASVAKHLISGKLEILSNDIDLEVGEGKVVNVDGQRIGAFKDEKGKVHMVDTTCTHMGCEVQWNSAERSWDCPCHGSRFTYEGDIIDGPALNPLKHLDDLPNDIDPKFQ